MRLPGWCERCRKVGQVTVSHAGMMSAAQGGVPMGTCQRCERKEQDERKERT